MKKYHKRKEKRKYGYSNGNYMIPIFLDPSFANRSIKSVPLRDLFPRGHKINYNYKTKTNIKMWFKRKLRRF